MTRVRFSMKRLFLFSIQIDNLLSELVRNDIVRLMLHKSEGVGNNDCILADLIKDPIFDSSQLIREKIHIDIGIMLQRCFFEISPYKYNIFISQQKIR